MTGSGAEVGDAIVDSPDVLGHLVHRLVGDRQAHRRAGRPAPQARLARARWQERGRRPRRRGPRPRHGRDPVVGLRDDRSALHGGVAGHRRAAGRGALLAAPRDEGAQAPARLRARPHRRTSARSSTPAPPTRSPRTSTSVAARATSSLGGGRATGDGLANGHFFEPTIFAGVGADGPDRPGGDLRAGPVGHRRSTTTARRCWRSTRPATACRRASSPAT